MSDQESGNDAWSGHANAAALFADVVDGLAGEPGVTRPGEGTARGFGSSALRVDGSIFAMLTRENLVVKLPARRVDELVLQGAGIRFDAGKGTPMKQWLTVTDLDETRWRGFADEALSFVRSSTTRRPPNPVNERRGDG